MQTFPADLPCFHRLPTLTQYVLGGDFSGQTDNLIYDPGLSLLTRTATHSGLADDTLTAATELWAVERPVADDRIRGNKLHAASSCFCQQVMNHSHIDWRRDGTPHANKIN